MKPSPSLRATLKRFAWLWGAVLGLLLLPLLVITCFYPIVRLVSIPPGIILGPFDFPSFSRILAYLIRGYGFWSVSLGCCSAMLWMGHRSWKWRLASIAVAVVTMTDLLLNLWKFWQPSLARPSSRRVWDNLYLSSLAAECAPLILAASFLLLFAVFMRSSDTSATKARGILRP